MRKKSIKTALVTAEALGWIDTTVKGKASHEDNRYPSRYALTWLPQLTRGKPASNRWREIKNDEQAQAILREALARREAERDQRAARGLIGQRRVPKLKAVA